MAKGKVLRRNAVQARAAVHGPSGWWDKPEHKGQPGDEDLTITDSPDDPAHKADAPVDLDPGWREVAPGEWVNDNEEEDL